MIKKLSVFMTIAVVALGLSSCKFNFDGKKESVVINGTKQSAYTFNKLSEVRSSLKYLEDDMWGQISFGNDAQKDFDKEKDKITYDYTTTITGTDKKVVVVKQKIFHETSRTSLGGGYSMARGTYTGGMKIYVFDEVQDKWSDAWYFDFGCKAD